MERVFAMSKENHGLQYARLRTIKEHWNLRNCMLNNPVLGRGDSQFSFPSVRLPSDSIS